MPNRSPALPSRWAWRAGLVGLVCVGLLLAGCTRSANPRTLPTATLEGGGPGAGDTVIPGVTGDDATMAAIGTQVAGQLTATAAAALGGAGGAAATQGVPGALPTDAGQPPAATAIPGALPTSVPPAATATAIPQATSVPAGAPCPNPYTVQQGEWIYAIARKCGVSAQAIIAANPGIDPNRLSPGQVLNMPAAGATPVPGVPPTAAPATGCTGTYIVVTGDTLWRIATRCGITVEALAAANGIPYPYNNISVGQVLRFP